MRKIIVIVMCALPFFSQSQAEGVQFEKGLTWEHVRLKAEKENKYIFVDCYATWCGSCKIMDNEVFPQKEVGDYFNNHFISIKLQMDQTKQDPVEIKKWYETAKQFENLYQVNSYPTYLFFSPDGMIVHHITGATDADNFIARSEEALVPEKQYYTMMEHWKEHLNDSVFLQHALVMSEHIMDKEKSGQIGEAYLNSLQNPFTKENVRLLSEAIHSSKDRAFRLFINNEEKIAAVTGDIFFVKNTIARFLYKDEIRIPLWMTQERTNWQSLEGAVKSKYSQLSIWKTNNTDSAFLSYFLTAAQQSGDNDNNRLMSEAYLAVIKNFFTKEHIQILSDFISNSEKTTTGKWFQFLLTNRQKVNEIMGKQDYAEKRLVRIVNEEKMAPLFQSSAIIRYSQLLENLQQNFPELKTVLDSNYPVSFQYGVSSVISSILRRLDANIIDDDFVTQQLKSKFPGYNFDKVLLKSKIDYYGDKKLWEQCEISTGKLLRQFGDQMKDDQINEEVWEHIFLHGTKEEPLREAIKWMEISTARKPVTEHYDTYANLLYKSGKTDEAIIWENKALALARQSASFFAKGEVKSFENTIKKMQRNEPTWQ